MFCAWAFVRYYLTSVGSPEPQDSNDARRQKCHAFSVRIFHLLYSEALSCKTKNLSHMKSKLISIALITLAILGLNSCSSRRLITPTPFERIIEAPGNTQDELYIKAHEWFVKQFTSAKSVIQFQDKENGKIMGKYVADLPETTSYYFESTQIISLDIRAGKVRLIISDPCVAQGPKNIAGVRGPLGNCIPSVTDKGHIALMRSWENLARSLEQYLNTDNDW